MKERTEKRTDEIEADRLCATYTRGFFLTLIGMFGLVGALWLIIEALRAFLTAN